MTEKTRLTSPQPPLDAMLLAIKKFLEQDIMPGLQGPPAFGMRMALRQLEAAAREAELAPDSQRREQKGLERLLQRSGELPELQRDLANLIRARQFRGDNVALRKHLEQGLHDDLRINNPKWLVTQDT